MPGTQIAEGLVQWGAIEGIWAKELNIQVDTMEKVNLKEMYIIRLAVMLNKKYASETGNFFQVHFLGHSLEPEIRISEARI